MGTEGLAKAKRHALGLMGVMVSTTCSKERSNSMCRASVTSSPPRNDNVRGSRRGAAWDGVKGGGGGVGGAGVDGDDEVLALLLVLLVLSARGLDLGFLPVDARVGGA